MKLIIVACLATVAFAAPKPQGGSEVAILRDDRVDNGDGNFNYAFELDDGTSISASGTPGASGAVSIQGSYRYTLPDGVVVEITYIADENGFQPTGDVIPTPHPLPAHALKQIAFAEQQGEFQPIALQHSVIEG